MPKIQSQTIEIVLSKLVKNSSDDNNDIVPNELVNTLESVVQELVGDNIVVEVLIK